MKIKLTENRLRQLVENTTREVIKEYYEGTGGDIDLNKVPLDYLEANGWVVSENNARPKWYKDAIMDASYDWTHIEPFTDDFGKSYRVDGGRVSKLDSGMWKLVGKMKTKGELHSFFGHLLWENFKRIYDMWVSEQNPSIRDSKF